MPGLDGLELSDKIRECNRNSQIIILSGHSTFEYAKKALDLGVMTYHLKPVNIKELIQSVVNAKDRIQLQTNIQLNLKKQFELEKENLVRKLINGELQNFEGIQTSLNQYFNFTEKYNVALLLVAIEKNVGPITEFKDSTLYRHIENWIGEKQHIIYELDNQLLVIFEDKDANRNSLMKRKLQNLYEGLSSASSKTSIAFAGCGPNTEIYQLYNQALWALQHRLYLGKEKLLIFDELESVSSEVFNFNIARQELSEHIYRYDAQSAMRLIVTTLNKFQALKCIDNKLIQNVCFSYKNVLINTLGLQGKDIKLLFDLEISSSSTIPDFTTIQEYIDWMDHIYSKILDGFSKINGLKHNSLVYKAVIYMNEHYFENLNVKSLSDYIELSPDYFSRLFNKEMGKSFNQYLNEIRIIEAKKLFKTTNLLAYEISEKVGFNTYKYFTQVFKELEGHSPSYLRK
jgi:two-component system response regulator YesN